MLQGWVVIAVALAYIGLLFLVASYGDRTRDKSARPAAAGRPPRDSSRKRVLAAKAAPG